MRAITTISILTIVCVAVALAQQRAPTQPQPPARGTPAPPQRPTPPANQPAAPPAQGSAPRSADEQAIRQLIDAVTRAFNEHDAKALAALFAPEGELVDEQGSVSQGREAIQELFTEVFQEYPQAKMEIELEGIRFLGPAVAIEDGVTKITHVPDEPAEHSRYSVVHMKQDGRWMVASSRDVSDHALRAKSDLAQLAWLIGEWVDESPDAVAKTSYRWDSNHRFIVGEFALHVEGKPAMSGSQRIGWDPLAKQVRSWVFDSEGGFGEGMWNQMGNQWIVKYTGVSGDGQVGSSTNSYTRLAGDAFAFESHDRMVGGEPIEDTPVIVVVRVPPKPEE